MKRTAFSAILGLSLLAAASLAGEDNPNSQALTELYGYNDCVKLDNGKGCVAAVSGACGGRILEYSLNGVNAIYVNPAQNGWTYTPGKPSIDPSGGRMDIGPEHTIPRHLDLWAGRWQVQRLGPLSARMSSMADSATGVQLVRDFVLDANSTTLKVTQTIKNISSKPVTWFHWSRTFATPGGICIVPLAPGSRFPGNYASFEPSFRVSLSPSDENVKLHGDTLFVTGQPKYAKLGFDCSTGQAGYITRDGLLFIKQFPVYPDKPYGELVAINFSVCYQKTFCEIEPIGPQETIQPGAEASFTETWSLAQCEFPKDPKPDFDQLRKLLK